MPASWIKEIPAAETLPEKEYFVCLRWEHPPGRFHYSYWSRWLNGKEAFSGKPGIAVRVQGGQQLVRYQEANKARGMDIYFLEVPADAGKRWRARQPPLRRADGSSRHRPRR